MNLYSYLWLAWLALFLPIEFKALASKKRGRTLSAHCWFWFCFDDAGSTRAYWRTRRAVFCTFWTALTLHFVVELAAWPYLVVSAVPFIAVILGSSYWERERP